MNILNRQINTGFNKASSQNITLEALKSTVYKGKGVNVGSTISVDKTEAKRILTNNKGVYKIKMD